MLTADLPHTPRNTLDDDRPDPNASQTDDNHFPPVDFLQYEEDLHDYE